jgi:hypothetical protein
MNDKLHMKIEVHVSTIDELKGLLLDIVALQEKYDIELTINYLSSTLETMS